MFRNLFTIVVVPRRTAQVKKIRVPLIVALLVLILVVGILVGWSIILRDYLSLRERLDQLEPLKQEYSSRQRQLNDFSSKIVSVDEHFETLDSLNHKLKNMMIQSGDETEIIATAKSENQLKNLEKAKSDGILSIIASDSSQIDAELKYEQEIKSENLLKFFTSTQNALSRVPSKMPTKGYIVQSFGTSFDPYTGESRPQAGIDVTTHNYQPILAPADGIVLSISKDEIFGNMMVIDHGNGFATRYGHISKFEVAEGDLVQRGSLIALTGNTGHTTGPRLRFEVLYNNVPMDPERFALN